MADLLPINEMAPDFELPSESGETVRLSSFRNRQPVLIFFYPADFTPVCTAEVCAFRDEFTAFRDRGIVLLGISGDTVEKHRRFAQQMSVPYRLLSDRGLQVAKAYGAKGLLGLRRAYYLIDLDGRVVWQHAEVLPIFKLSNERLLEVIDKYLPGHRANDRKDSSGSGILVGDAASGPGSSAA